MWQNFFENEKKNLNPYIFKLENHKKYILYSKEEMDVFKNRWKEYFNNENPLYLEIGSGAGNFLVANAEKFKDANFIGVELRFKRLVLSAKKADKRNLENITFLRRRGEEILDFLGENEIAGMYINFPDPWDTKNREKNRILKKELFDKLDKVMKKGGKLFFKTDHEGYYRDTLELMKGIDNYKVIYNTEDLHNTEIAEINIKTEFEQLFLSKGIKIKYIEIEKEV